MRDIVVTTKIKPMRPARNATIAACLVLPPVRRIIWVYTHAATPAPNINPIATALNILNVV